MGEKPNMFQAAKEQMGRASGLMAEAALMISTLGDEASELRVRVGILEVRAKDAIDALEELTDGGRECRGLDTQLNMIVRGLKGLKHGQPD